MVSFGGESVAPRSSFFDIQVQTGSGGQFPLSVHSGLKVNDVHMRISKMQGERECPLYAIRLIHRSKVLSHRPDEPLSSFDIAEGDVLQLVVVRRGPPSELLLCASPSIFSYHFARDSTTSVLRYATVLRRRPSPTKAQPHCNLVRRRRLASFTEEAQKRRLPLGLWRRWTQRVIDSSRRMARAK